MNLTSLEDVVTAATTVNDLAALAVALKALLKRDLAEPMLASKLANDEDPLALLDPGKNTLGYLYILSVSFLCLKSRNANRRPLDLHLSNAYIDSR
jgi:COP9 signalosome complex subunit 3